jgi:predicted Zn-dependent protease
VLVAVVLLAVSASLLLGRAIADEPVRPARVVVVHPGETLWQITGRLVPGEDPRPAILRIQEANGLTDAGVHPGQRLRIPGDI